LKIYAAVKYISLLILKSQHALSDFGLYNHFGYEGFHLFVITDNFEICEYLKITDFLNFKKYNCQIKEIERIFP
jgi:hypothetical protein